jgi:MFS family permease
MTALKTDREISPAGEPRSQIDERGLVWFYVGACLGPFGTTIVSVLLTTLGETYQVDLNVATLSITAYMIPFALSLLISGAISDAIGARQAVVGGCVVFGVASLVCAAAPTMEVFLVGRAFQGVGNAFTTSLLMASLGDLLPSHRLVRALGFFAAFQMAGGLFGPLISGFLALASWRLSFLLAPAPPR